MAGEIQARWNSAVTVYAQVRNAIGQIWSTAAGSFGAYLTANVADYAITLTEQGTASGLYAGNFPSTIAAGVYYVTAWQRLGSAPAETDTFVGSENFQWNGTNALPLSDIATSGQLALYVPTKLARSWMVPNYMFPLRSSADHVSPLTSGNVSGQISRDGGAFGPLQSGAFTEIGMGWYKVQSLTSGDLNAMTVALHFTAAGVSGGSADPVQISAVLQRVSGAG